MARQEAQLVLSAFEKFNEASANLESAYQHLAKQFQSLSRELEEANRRLRRTVLEKERLGSHLSSVLESLECGVIVADRSGRLTHSNGAAAELLLDDRARVGELRELGELRRARPELDDVLDLDGLARYETRVSPALGEGERVLQVERRPLAGAETGGAVFVLRDLTELRDLEAQAQRMERLAAMGEMALELAHEIRNPLGGIRLHASLLASEKGLPEGARSWVQQLEVGVHTLNTVVSNMLCFGRPPAPARSAADLGGLVREVERFLEPLTRERQVRVALELEPLPRAPWLDESQMRQVLLNLWLNALNAMPRGGRLDIAVRPRDEASVELEFSDSGPGLPPEAVERVFDPFFSADRRGTGLGLAVASQLVEANGGEIRAESEAGRGATFRIHFPTTAEAACAVAR